MIRFEYFALSVKIISYMTYNVSTWDVRGPYST